MSEHHDWTARWREAGFRRQVKARTPDGDWQRRHDSGSSWLTVQRLVTNGRHMWRLMLHEEVRNNYRPEAVPRYAQRLESFRTEDEAWAATVAWMLAGDLPDAWPC